MMQTLAATSLIQRRWRHRRDRQALPAAATAATELPPASPMAVGARSSPPEPEPEPEQPPVDNSAAEEQPYWRAVPAISQPRRLIQTPESPTAEGLARPGPSSSSSSGSTVTEEMAAEFPALTALLLISHRQRPWWGASDRGGGGGATSLVTERIRRLDGLGAQLVWVHVDHAAQHPAAGSATAGKRGTRPLGRQQPPSQDAKMA